MNGGRKEKACKNTESPEKEREKDISGRQKISKILLCSAIKLQADPISKMEEKTERNTSLFIMLPNALIMAEKKII